MKELKDAIYNVESGDTNINIVLNTNNSIVRVTLNENKKINDSFINNISMIPFLEKIVVK